MTEQSQHMIQCRWYLRCAQELGLNVAKELELLDQMVTALCVGSDIDPVVYADFWPRFLVVGEEYDRIRSLDPERVALIEQSIQKGTAAVKACNNKLPPPFVYSTLQFGLWTSKCARWQLVPQ